MTFPEALEHLNALAPELAPPATPAPGEPPSPRRKFDLAHMRHLLAALGNPQDQVPSILIAGTNGKGSTAATLASILSAAGYRTGLYTSPHLIRVTERIQLSHPTLPSEYGATISAGAAPGADGPLAFSEIPDADFAALYTRVDEAAATLVCSGDLPYPPSFFERLTALAFLFFADRQAESMVLEVGLGGRLDATNVVTPLLSIITDIALDHQEYLGSTIAEITSEKCGILRERGTLITLPQLPEANHAIGLAAAALHVHAINAADYIPPPDRHNDNEALPAPQKDRHSERSEESQQLPTSTQPSLSGARFSAHSSDEWVPSPDGAAEHSNEWIPLLPPNHYTLHLPTGDLLQVHSPLPGQHQRRNIALAIAAAIELRARTNPRGLSSRSSQDLSFRGEAEEPSVAFPESSSNHSSYKLARSSNRTSYNLSNSAIEAGIRITAWPARLEFIPPNLLLDVAHNPAGAWTLRAAIASLPPAQPRTLIFSCLRDKNLQEISRTLFPLFDSSLDADPLRRHDHILLAPIANARAAPVEDLLAAAHAVSVPAHAAPHLAAALSQARQVTPAGGLIIATGSVYLVGEIRALALAAEQQ